MADIGFCVGISQDTSDDSDILAIYSIHDGITTFLPENHARALADNILRVCNQIWPVEEQNED